MAGRPPTAPPSFMTIFFTSTTWPVAAGCSPGISSHLPRVTKHPWRVDIRGSPAASRMPPCLAPKRLDRTKRWWYQFQPRWYNAQQQINPWLGQPRRSAARLVNCQARRKQGTVSGLISASFQGYTCLFVSLHTCTRQPKALHKK